jgi:hypothetical protein
LEKQGWPIAHRASKKENGGAKLLVVYNFYYKEAGD